MLKFPSRMIILNVLKRTPDILSGNRLFLSNSKIASHWYLIKLTEKFSRVLFLPVIGLRRIKLELSCLWRQVSFVGSETMLKFGSGAQSKKALA